MSQKKYAIIIGAGPAGLTAGYELLTKSRDIQPIILEAENFVGGISRTATYKNNRMDIGGHRFFSKEDKVNALWTKMLPLQSAPSFDDLLLNRGKPLSNQDADPEKTDEVMLVRDRVSRIIWQRKFFDYPISLKAQTFANMGFFKTLQAGFGYLGSCLHKRPETSLENFYINRFGKPLYAMFFEDYTQKLWGIHPSDISADWGAQRVKGLSVSKAIQNAFSKLFKKQNKTVETSLIEQFTYPKKGPGQLYEKMADEIIHLGGEIRLNQTVGKINVSGDKIVSVETLDHKVYPADFVLSSMPIKDLAQAIGKECMPKDVYQTATKLPYRDFMTVGLLLNGLKVKNKTKIKTLGNIVPDCWIYVQDKDVKLGRIQIFNNWSPYMVENPMQNIWVGLEYFCDEGDEMWTSADETFIQNAIDELIKIGFIENKEVVLDSTLIRVKKAYPAYFGSYQNFEIVKEYLSGIENLWCIGRNGQHRYNNMDHSMLTAMVAVDKILAGDGSKVEVWQVNTEKVYHETKSKP